VNPVRRKIRMNIFVFMAKGLYFIIDNLEAENIPLINLFNDGL
jgi:hypothetical protein